jgi:hypothetical protein
MGGIVQHRQAQSAVVPNENTEAQTTTAAVLDDGAEMNRKIVMIGQIEA